MDAKDAKALRIAPLNTPTDLKSNAVRDISGALTTLTASQDSLMQESRDWSGAAWASREGPDERDKQSSAHGCD
jgi:hypothetical protein